RLAPTLTAPGTHVTGAASDSTNFDGTGVCGRALSSLLPGEPFSNARYYPANQKFYTWSSGPSHSTPIVADAAVLLHQYSIRTIGSTPSPALIKAALVAGTIDPVGGRTNAAGGGLLGLIPNNPAG